VKFVGIDLSVNPCKCGVCVLEGNAVTHVGHGRSTFEHPEWLVEHCSEADAVGVDVPFGWPKAFIDTLSNYEIGVALNRDRRPYRLRTTDTWIVETLPRRLTRHTRPPAPFSVSTDKLGATAMVGSILLGTLSGEFRLSPRQCAVPGAVLEVYPAASLWCWGLPHRDIEVFIALGTLQEAFRLEIRSADRELLLESRHCFDGLIAALTAREYANGNTFDPPEPMPDRTLRVEGWIRVPNRHLDDAPDARVPGHPEDHES
jgi:predicted nuclease with RNAse H fold